MRFRFSAAAIGEAGLRFDVFVGDSDAASDSASFDVPVLGRQGGVFLATSFALTPSSGSGSGNGSAAAAGQVEGLALPAADPGSGSVDLTAGVGNLPFLQVGSGCGTAGCCACWGGGHWCWEHGVGGLRPAGLWRVGGWGWGLGGGLFLATEWRGWCCLRRWPRSWGAIL